MRVTHPTRSRLAPHVPYLRVVPLLPVLVRVLVVVELGRRVHYPDLVVVQGREAVIHQGRYLDELRLLLPDLYLLHYPLRRRALPRVVEAHEGVPFDRGEVVPLELVVVPTLHDA